MQPRYVIKLSSKSSLSIDKQSKSIIVGLNVGKSNGPYIARLGYCKKISNKKTFYFIDLLKLGFWLNKGATLSSKVSWIVGFLTMNKRQSLVVSHSTIKRPLNPKVIRNKSLN
jgi:ribosomal protein S16